MHPLAGTEEHTMQERPSVHDSRRAHAHASKSTPAGSHALRLGEDRTRVRADGPARSSRASRRPTPAHDHARTPSRATARSGREGYVRASVSTPHSTHESALRREFRIRKLFTRALPLALVLIAIVAGFSAWSAHRPITVTINDAKVQLKDDRTIDAAFDLSGIEVKPGDLVDVEGDVLTEGGGTRYTATVDGAAVDDPDRTLKNGAVVQVSDGTNIEEDSTIDENAALPSKRVAKGSGPLCVKQDGHDGVASIKTGSVSGKQVVEEVKQDPVDTTYLRYYPEVGNDKVIALTFDDGPVAKQTEELLDVLADNGAKATFFTIGAQITGTAADDVVREEKDGHQVATHTWDHAAGSGQGVNLSYMTADEQRDEITKGLSGIAGALGHEVSPVLRAPGGNFPTDSVWVNVDDLITAQIGWNIDTMDWSRPGVDHIVSQIESARPGDVILMHDGGGDRSQTIEALKTALPYLKEQGYRFITIDELLKYPPADEPGAKVEDVS